MSMTRGDRLPGNRRPDQQYDPPGPLVSPGGRAGTFKGRLVVIFGTGANMGLFVYSPTPAAGNLVASIIATATATDPYGNTVIGPGFASYSIAATNYAALLSGSAVAFYTAATPHSTWTFVGSLGEVLSGSVNIMELSGPLVLSSSDPGSSIAAGALALFGSSHLEVRAGDGIVYNTERLSKVAVGDTIVNTFGSNKLYSGLSGITIPAAGTYRIDGALFWTQDTAAVNQIFSFQGANLTSGTRVQFTTFNNNNASPTTTHLADIVDNSNNNGGVFPAWANGALVFVSYFTGVLKFSAADTFGLQGQEGTNGDTYTIKSGSFFDLMPVT